MDCVRTLLTGVVALAVAACASDEAEPGLPIAEAEAARELAFITLPRVERRTRSEFQATEDARGQRLSDAEVAEYHAVWGRLGFFPRTFDVRSASGSRAGQVAAFYSTAEKSITLLDGAPRATVVHELVHALQDQHFDLSSFDARATSSDEVLAVRAVAEGDADVSELRYVFTSRRTEPLAALGEHLTDARARDLSDRFIERTTLPPFFSAYASFAYPYGAALVARALGLREQPPRWTRDGADALFSSSAPRTTEEVLRRGRGLDVDPVVDVGLTRVPEPLAGELELDGVDRIGSWYARLLFAEHGGTMPDVETTWDGDQLVALRLRDTRVPPPERAAVAIVWTSAWDDDVVATRVQSELERIHAADAGEPHVLDRRGNVVVLAKGTLAAETLRTLASAALYDRDDAPRLSIRRRWAGAELFRP